MSMKQLEALRALNLALEIAGTRGIFDNWLNVYIHPDVINQFCDAVNALENDNNT